MRERDTYKGLLKRGDIVYIDIPKDDNNPHKQNKARPCIIVSNDKNNEFCSMIHYVPLTSRLEKAKLPTHILIKDTRLPKNSFALCEGINQIDKQFVTKKIGTMSDSDMVNIDIGMMKQICQSKIVYFVINNLERFIGRLSFA